MTIAENPLQEPAPPEPSGPTLFAAGFVLPCTSLSFYRRALRPGVGRALLFFLIFMALVAALSTAGLAVGMFSVAEQIRGAFAQGRVPEITISGGQASVRGPQSVVLFDQNGTLVAIDVTGAQHTIDGARYTAGVLLTQSELVVLNGGQVRSLPLQQINQLFQQDPLVINAETSARFWQTFSAWFSVAALLALFFWDIGVRLAYLAALAVLVFGIMGLVKRMPYSTVLTVGVYAFVPALIAVYILNRLGIRFLFLQTLILLLFWGIGLYAVQVPNGWDLLGPDRPLRAWRAWLGLPLLGVLALDILLTWPNGGLVDLITAAVSGIALVAAGMLSLPSREESA